MKGKLASPQEFWKPGLAVLKTGLLFAAFVCLTVFMAGVPNAESKETEILLLHTNNVTGHLFPCPT